MADVRVGLYADLDSSGVINGVKAMQGAFNGLKLPDNLTKDASQALEKLTKSAAEYKRLMDKPSKTKADYKAIEKQEQIMTAAIDKINSSIDSLNGKKFYLDADLSKIQNAQKEIDKLKNDITTTLSNLKLEMRGPGGKFTTDFDTLLGGMDKAISRSTTLKTLMSSFKEQFQMGNIDGATKQLDQIEQHALTLKGSTANLLETFKQIGLVDFSGPAKELSKLQSMDFMKQGFAKIKEQIAGAEPEIHKIVEELEKATLKKAEFERQGQINASNAVAQGAQNMQRYSSETQKAIKANNEFNQSVQSTAQQVQQLQQSTQYFFGLRNMLNLLKRGFKEAVQSVKELDKAMTETAVVTNFSVSDMWNMLPQYTQIANELGATTQGAYETMTLYFQQGLDQQAAFEIGEETMKMARIAGLDYAKTTDMMTAALRGFNMELNEVSAKNINDVYSNLAAKTASNTQELGNAMQRTASIAHSAGMSFEGTAAFLAQAIETTREPAENIGTAMKTIVARFQELKKNPLEITEVDGEEVSYNKIDTALQSIGVNLKKTNGEFRNLDEVFLDISQRWDSLSQTQQRYIATTAAGSRQQSRFIAMMSNYRRTVELMNYATNSEGASEEQFNKTLESFESKVNKLKNAWQQFLMSIADNTIVKGIVDGLTNVLTVTNKLIDTLSLGSSGLKSFFSLFLAFKGLSFAGNFVNKLLGGLGGMLTPGATFAQGYAAAAGKTNPQAVRNARFITTPIIAKISEVVGAIKQQNIKGTKQASTLADYKNAVQAFRNVGTASFEEVGNIFKNLSDEHAQAAFNNAPGTVSAMQRASLQWLENQPGINQAGLKTGQQLMKAIYKGMAKKQIPVKKGIELLGHPEQWGHVFGTQVAQDFSKTFLDSKKNRIAKDLQKATTKAWNNLSWNGKHIKASEREAFLQTPFKDSEGRDITGRTRFLQARKNAYLKLRAQRESEGALPTVQTNQLEQAANVAGQLGNKFTSAGFAIQNFGMQLSMISPALAGVGNLLTKVGSAVTVFGMSFSGLGKIPGTIATIVSELGGLSVALPLLAIVGAGVGAIAYDAIKDKKIKESAEDIKKTFEDTNATTTENINNLQQWQKEFAALSKGVDKNGNNASLSTEAYDRYKELVNKIAEINPEIVKGYNAQGLAIIDNNTALERTLELQQAIRKEATRKYTSNKSLNKLIEARQLDDELFETKRGERLGTQTNATRRSLISSLKGEINFDELYKQIGFDLETASEAQLSRNYKTIEKAIDTMLGDDMSKRTSEALSDFVEAEEYRAKANEDIYKALSTYAQQQRYTTTIPENLLNEYEAGLKEKAATANDASEAKKFARDYAKELKALGGETSKAGIEFEKLNNAQKQFGKDFNVNDYSTAIKEPIAKLTDLSTRYKQSGDELKIQFAETIDQMIAEANAYATQGGGSIIESLNTTKDSIDAVTAAYEEFQKALEGSSVEKATESLKNIADAMYDGTHALWGGDKTFWQGAKNFVSDQVYRSGDFEEADRIVQAMIPALEDSEAGYEAAGYFIADIARQLEQSNSQYAQYLKATEDGGFEIATELLTDEMVKGIADDTHVNADALNTILTKVSRIASFSTWDFEGARNAYIGDERVYQAEGGKLYIKQGEFENDLLDAGVSQDKWYGEGGAFDEAKKHDIELIPDQLIDGTGKFVDGVEDQLKSMGVNASNYMSRLDAMGYNEEDILAYGQKIDPNATPEELQEAYNNMILDNLDPITSNIQSSLDRSADTLDSIYAVLAKGNLENGEATDKDFKGEENLKNAQEDKGLNNLASGKSITGKKLTESSYKRAKKYADEQIAGYLDYWTAAYNGLQEAKKAGNPEQIKKYTKDVEKAEAAYKYAVDARNGLVSHWRQQSHLGKNPGLDTLTYQDIINQRNGIAPFGFLYHLFNKDASWFGKGFQPSYSTEKLQKNLDKAGRGGLVNRSGASPLAPFGILGKYLSKAGKTVFSNEPKEDKTKSTTLDMTSGLGALGKSIFTSSNLIGALNKIGTSPLLNLTTSALSNILPNKYPVGNTDLNNRQVLDWSKEPINSRNYKNAADWGYSPQDLQNQISTYLSSGLTFSDAQGDFGIAFTPMLQTENGPQVLSSQTVGDYFNQLITGATDKNGNVDFEALLAADHEGIGNIHDLIMGAFRGTPEEIEGAINNFGDVTHIMSDLITQGYGQAIQGLDPVAIAQNAEAYGALQNVYQSILEGTLPSEEDLAILQSTDLTGAQSQVNLQLQALSMMFADAQEAIMSMDSLTPEQQSAALEITSKIQEWLNNTLESGVAGVTTPPPSDLSPTIQHDQEAGMARTEQLKVETDDTELEETKQKTDEVKNAINEGAKLTVSVPGSDTVSKVAKDVQKINNAQSNKDISVTAHASGTDEVNKLISTGTKAQQQLHNHSVNYTASVSGTADTQAGYSAGINFQSLHDHKVTYTTEYKTIGSKPPGQATGSHNHGYVASPLFGSAAKGYGQVGPKGKGGLTLTGELGYEIAWLPSENRSMILGANGPQMINLPGDAVVWTHEQSKKILKQKSIPAGSQAYSKGKWTPSGGGSSNGGSSSDTSKAVSKAASDTSNAASTVNTVAGWVSVWWENMARRVDATQRKIDRSLDLFNKQIKTFGTTASSIQGTIASYRKDLQTQINLSNQQISQAKYELGQISAGGGENFRSLQEISWQEGTDSKESKKETINLTKFIYYNQETGTWEISQAALDKTSSKSKKEAMKSLFEKEINDRVSKLKSAEDNLKKAQEALDKLNDDVYETFYRWEKSINKVYLLSQKLEILSNKLSIAGSKADLQFSKLEVGITKAAQSFEKVVAALDEQKKYILQQANASLENVKATRQEYQDAFDLSKYIERFYKSPDSLEARNDLRAATQAFSILKQIDFNSDNFNYDAALQYINKQNITKDEYEAIKQVIDNIFEKQNKYFESTNTALGNINEIYKTMEEYQSFIAQFEEELLSGLEEQTENEIKRLDKLNSALSKAYKDLLDEVKRAIDERRKQEDNAKTESDLSKKQQRLALLQADTSGSNAVEIAKLQQEIADSQQSYQRSLEDQLIDKLQQQGDIAEKQRQRQIDLLNIQAEVAKQTGTNIEEVRKWLEDPQAYYEDIRQAWLANKNYDNATPGQRKQLEEQFEAEFAKYQGYSVELKKYDDMISSLQNLEDSVSQIATNVKLTGKKSVAEMKAAGYSADSLKKSGIYSDSEILSSKAYDGKELRAAGYSASTLKQNKYSFGQVKNGYTLSELRDAGYSAEEAAPYGYTYSNMRDAGYTTSQLKATQRYQVEAQSEENVWAQVIQAVKSITGNSSRGPIIPPQNGVDAVTATKRQAQVMGMAIDHTLFNKPANLDFGVSNDGYIYFHDGKGNIKSYNPNNGTVTKVYSFNEAQFKKFAGVQTNWQYQNNGGNNPEWKWAWKEAYEALRYKYPQKYPHVYKTGGLADYTGPAWLDGTPTKPELVLNATDTKNFLALKDVLKNVMGSIRSAGDTTYGNMMYEVNINVDHINNDYDVDKIAKRIEKNIIKNASYRNVTQVRNFR